MKPTRRKGIKPFQVNTPDDDDQAEYIANKIIELTSKGYQLDEIAVLYRAGFHSFKIELELQSKNISYVVRSGVSFFEKAHIKDLLVHLRIIENPSDELSWIRICSMIQGIGRNISSKIFEKIASAKNPIAAIIDPGFFSAQLSKTKVSSRAKRNLILHMKNLENFTPKDNPSEVISNVIPLIRNYIKSKYGDWQDRMEDLKQLCNYANNYKSIQQFLEFLSLNKSNIESKLIQTGNNKAEGKSVVLSTIHRAKGLEWRVVFIPMLSEGYFPSSRVLDKSEEFEEERRIFYVAVSRAKDQLYLITPSTLNSRRGARAANTSLFISELNPNVYQEICAQYKDKPIGKEKFRASSFPNKRKSKFPAEFLSADSLLKNKD
jgi:DNA helicase-2/ATP-dependent DNA helicase PcrA